MTTIPAHVRPCEVSDFDFRNPPGADTDVHLAWKQLHNGPDIVWTPHHGGHWIATRADDIDVMQTDHERFSYQRITIPIIEEFPRLAPLEYDPPEHSLLRAVISPAFGPRVMQELEHDLRKLAVDLLDEIVPRGECEFIDAFAKRLPIVTFLRLVNLPLEDRDLLLDLTEKSVRPQTEADRHAAYDGLDAYCQKWIADRMRNPGKDLFSRMVHARIGDRAISEYELAGMLPNVIFGGLDTVSSALSFTARYLATDAALRHELRAQPKLIPQAIEEFLRRFGIPNTARYITRDMDYRDLRFKAGEQILLPKTCHGLDERRYPDPLKVNIHRDVRRHAAFGDGPHRCPGSFLARLEMRIFIEEWLARIPDFEIADPAAVRTASGPVNGVLNLPLTWH